MRNAGVHEAAQPVERLSNNTHTANHPEFSLFALITLCDTDDRLWPAYKREEISVVHALQAGRRRAVRPAAMRGPRMPASGLV